MARSSPPDTAQRILDVAERLVQTRGFNGFSYADIATKLSITKASLHYHFPTKAALGCALIARYARIFAAALESIDTAGISALQKLARYVRLYTAVLNDDRMCLCGMVAAEYATLPKGMQEQIREFFTANEEWLAKVLDEGVATGELRVRGSSLDAGRLLISALEGAMLVARSYQSPARFEVAAERLLDDLCVETPGGSTKARATQPVAQGVASAATRSRPRRAGAKPKS